MCAHAVSVRLGRLEGVESVTISLNEGRADLALKADNTISLAEVHEVVKQAGFTPRTARVTARAEVTAGHGAPVIRVTGTRESFAASLPDQGTRDRLKDHAGATVIVEGIIEAPEEGAEPRITVTSIEPEQAAR